MTIRESISFTYDGVSSLNKSIYSVNLSNGLYEEPFMSSRSINETTVKNKEKPYFQGVTRSPKTFTLSFYFDGFWDDAKIQDVARWLSPDYYKPLIFNEFPNKIFYCMPVDDIGLIHNGLKQGYLNLTMRCDSPYAYSPFITSSLYTYTSNAVGQYINITNGGDTIIYPEISLKKLTGSGDVKIKNVTNNNEEFKFTGLALNEDLYIDNENRNIETSLSGTNRYNAFNGNYLKLLKGDNQLMIIGDCSVQFKYEEKYLH